MIRGADHSQGRAVMLVAHATILEALRRKVTWLIGASAMLLLVAGFGLRDLHFGGAPARFLIDVGFGTIGLGGTVLATFGTAQCFFGDLDSRLWQFVLARPVGRTTWLLGKYVGVGALLGGWSAAMTIALLTLLWTGEGIADVEFAREIVAGSAVLWLRGAMIAAGTLFFCSYARSAFFAAGVAALSVLVGHLRPLAAQWPVEASVGGVLGQLLRAWPDLQAFEPTEAGSFSIRLIAYGLGYVVLLLAAAGIVFRRREL